MKALGLYSIIALEKPGMIVFVGDWVRQGNNWFQVVDCDGGMQFQAHDGRWLWADEGDVDEIRSHKEHEASGDWDGIYYV